MLSFKQLTNIFQSFEKLKITLLKPYEVNLNANSECYFNDSLLEIYQKHKASLLSQYAHISRSLQRRSFQNELKYNSDKVLNSTLHELHDDLSQISKVHIFFYFILIRICYWQELIKSQFLYKIL